MGHVAQMVDFIDSLALIGMLSLAFGAIRRKFGQLRRIDLFNRDVVLGVTFGVVALLQMNDPISPFEGVRIDMRNIPVALAGAFLGFRGLATCLAIGIAARLNLGGDGALAGVLGMILAGGSGLLWHHLTIHHRRGGAAMLGLSLMMSTHLSAGLMLSPDVAAWFFQNAAPVILGLNVLTVPILALLLENERRRIVVEDRLRMVADMRHGHVFMPRDAMAWALDQGRLSGTVTAPVAAIAIDLDYRDMLGQLWGNEVDRSASQEVHARLTELMPVGAMVGWLAHDQLVMICPETSAGELDVVVSDIRRDVSQTPLAMPNGTQVKLNVSMTVECFDEVPDIAMLEACFSTSPPRRTDSRETVAATNSSPTDTWVNTAQTSSVQTALFETYEKLKGTADVQVNTG